MACCHCSYCIFLFFMCSFSFGAQNPTSGAVLLCIHAGGCSVTTYIAMCTYIYIYIYIYIHIYIHMCISIYVCMYVCYKEFSVSLSILCCLLLFFLPMLLEIAHRVCLEVQVHKQGNKRISRSASCSMNRRSSEQFMTVPLQFVYYRSFSLVSPPPTTLV